MNSKTGRRKSAWTASIMATTPELTKIKVAKSLALQSQSNQILSASAQVAFDPKELHFLKPIVASISSYSLNILIRRESRPISTTLYVTLQQYGANHHCFWTVNENKRKKEVHHHGCHKQSDTRQQLDLFLLLSCHWGIYWLCIGSDHRPHPPSPGSSLRKRRDQIKKPSSVRLLERGLQTLTPHHHHHPRKAPSFFASSLLAMKYSEQRDDRSPTVEELPPVITWNITKMM